MVKEVPGKGSVCRPGHPVYLVLVDISGPQVFQSYLIWSHSILLHTANPVCWVTQRHAGKTAHRGTVRDCDGAIVDKPGADSKLGAQGHCKDH